MLSAVFFMFSLFFVQQVASYFGVNADLTAEDMNELKVNFGSVQNSMFTLYKAMFGGDDWSVAYNMIQRTGYMAAGMFVIFVAFTQIAVINIITGIFVDSALQNLAV